MKIRNLYVSALNARGIAHFIVPALIVVAVGITGTALLVASHADPVSKRITTGTVQIRAYQVPNRNTCKFQRTALLSETPVAWFCNGKQNAPVAGTRAAHLQIISMDLHNTVQNPSPACLDARIGKYIKITVNKFVDFGAVRTLKCVPGPYNVVLAGSAAIIYSSNSSSQKHILHAGRSITIKANGTSTISLSANLPGKL